MNEQPGLFDDQPLPGEYEIPTDAQRGKCASCGAALIWIKTATGKAMPLSAKTERQISGVAYALTHSADCQHSKEWSRR